ncbi:hypothetical protein [Thioflexithrix psekupsensis]|nr:hypothetical protein [Thioflexithrix psekupsensis]
MNVEFLDVQSFPLQRSWNVVYLNEKKLSWVARVKILNDFSRY